MLPRLIFARWIRVGGLREVLRMERRCVEMKAESWRGGLLFDFRSAFVGGCCCASRDTMCRYLPHGEKEHFIEIWRAGIVD